MSASRLLLVEDDPVTARSVARVLRTKGYEIEIIHRCADLPRAAQEPFRVGIFDIDLPDGDGFSLAARALAEKVVRRAIFYSGRAAPTPVGKTLGTYVRKSDGMPPLIAAIEAAEREPDS